MIFMFTQTLMIKLTAFEGFHRLRGLIMRMSTAHTNANPTQGERQKVVVRQTS